MKSAPGEIAVSLSYDGENAPVVSAKGEGEIAKQILEIATEYDVPIYQDSQLASFLSNVDLDAEIPSQLYVAVAEIIAFAYRLKDMAPKERNYGDYSGGDTIDFTDIDDITPSSDTTQ
ncbi:MAG: EscU/YscU/HrcU family type III secretion system export apparatus switch protein [Spongiibacteraceae bacterium]